VYFVASTFRKGASSSAAIRRAISVFPTPVGPARMMFFGRMSRRIPSSSRCRRIRFRIATATARFASFCETMNRSR
jgi:hypothetical protein